MICIGANITSSADALKQIGLEYLYYRLIDPKPEIASLVHQLRIVYSVNPKKYAELKRSLPYVVCGTFNPPYRRTENFAYTEHFIIDIDHISEKQIDMGVLRKKLIADERVCLLFASPSEDGLKVFFQLKQRCYDAGEYSLFYKAFARSFSMQYGLEQVIDQRTSDVCRACFVSIDSEAYFNANAVPVALSAYLPTDDMTALMDLKRGLQNDQAESRAKTQREKPSSDPDSDVIQRIKAVLSTSQEKSVPHPEPYVPLQLDEIMDELKTYVQGTGVIVSGIQNIQYGKKIQMKMGAKSAEINLFYGKRGFSVVQSPKCGTSSEMNQLMADLIRSYIDIITA